MKKNSFSVQVSLTKKRTTVLDRFGKKEQYFNRAHSLSRLAQKAIEQELDGLKEKYTEEWNKANGSGKVGNAKK